MKSQDINLKELDIMKLSYCHNSNRAEEIVKQFLSDKLNRIEKEIDKELGDLYSEYAVKKIKQIIRQEFTNEGK